MRISDWSSDVCSSDLGSSCCLGDRSVGFLVDYLQRCRDAYPHGPLQEGPGACGRHELSDVRPPADDRRPGRYLRLRSEEHKSELQSLMRISYAVFCLKKKKENQHTNHTSQTENIYKDK